MPAGAGVRAQAIAPRRRPGRRLPDRARPTAPGARAQRAVSRRDQRAGDRPAHRVPAPGRSRALTAPRLPVTVRGGAGRKAVSGRSGSGGGGRRGHVPLPRHGRGRAETGRHGLDQRVEVCLGRGGPGDRQPPVERPDDQVDRAASGSAPAGSSPRCDRPADHELADACWLARSACCRVSAICGLRAASASRSGMICEASGCRSAVRDHRAAAAPGRRAGCRCPAAAACARRPRRRSPAPVRAWSATAGRSRSC